MYINILFKYKFQIVFSSAKTSRSLGFSAILYSGLPVESTNVISMTTGVACKVEKPPSLEYSAQKNLEDLFGTSPEWTVELFT